MAAPSCAAAVLAASSKTAMNPGNDTPRTLVENQSTMAVAAEISFQSFAPPATDPDRKPIPCDLCPYTSPSLFEFLMHMDHQHPDWWFRPETA